MRRKIKTHGVEGAVGGCRVRGLAVTVWGNPVGTRVWRERGRSSLQWTGLQGKTRKDGGIGNDRVKAEAPRADCLDQPHLGTRE